MNDAYLSLEKQFSLLSSLQDALGILGWDKEVMMPPGAADRRAENLAKLEGFYHQTLTSDQIKSHLATAQPDDNDAWQKANLREMRRAYEGARALPNSLVEDIVKTTAQCETLWRAGLKNGDFSNMFPVFERVVELTKKKALILSEKFSLDPYDTLLDSFEEGLRQADIDPLFTDLAKQLPPLVEKIVAYQNTQAPLPNINGTFPVDTQKELGSFIMQNLGFDPSFGRLDTSIHPFCGGARDDIRITTRYKPSDFLPALMGIIHETGHALYDLGLPRRWQSQPVGEACGMAIHESQSLLLEMQIGHSHAFLSWLTPILKKTFGTPLADFNEEKFYRLLTRVSPGFIRVGADEVTYPAHILIRYEIEKALINGELKVRELPEAFNSKVKEILGLTVEDNRLGCWQDIHWPEGLFGYFPCYSLGAFAAAQFRQKACEDDLQIMPQIEKGNFEPLRHWLRENIHSKGRLLPAAALIENVTHKPLGIDAWLEHIKRRYLTN